jgi:hypothetical protein
MMDEEILQKKLDKAAEEIADRIFQISQENVARQSVDTGQLLGSGDIEKTGVLGERRIIYRSPYAAAIEYGSDPHMPPVEPLKGWAHRKLGLPYDAGSSLKWNPDNTLSIKRNKNKGPTADDAAWAIAMTIKKEGTEPKPFLRPAVDSVRPLVRLIVSKHLSPK